MHLSYFSNFQILHNIPLQEPRLKVPRRNSIFFQNSWKSLKRPRSDEEWNLGCNLTQQCTYLLWFQLSEYFGFWGVERGHWTTACEYTFCFIGILSLCVCVNTILLTSACTDLRFRPKLTGYFGSTDKDPRLDKLKDRLCGLVVRVLGYRFGGPGLIPGTTRFSI
jgi:hypothetical protein